MFLPPDYLKMLGYDDLTAFTMSSFSVVVEDGQNLNPSFVIQNGGVLLDFGISHYSAPNPTLTVLVREKAIVTTKPTSQVLTVVLTQPKSAKSIAISAKMKVLSTSKVSLKVVASSAKFCRVSGASLKGLKAGSCKVTVTVKPKKGRAVSKTVTLKVTK